MELFGIGPLEFLVILLIALLIFSPKDLAKGGKELGRWINRLYRSETWKSMRQVSQEMQNLPNRLAREAKGRVLQRPAAKGGLQTPGEPRPAPDQYAHARALHG